MKHLLTPRNKEGSQGLNGLWQKIGGAFSGEKPLTPQAQGVAEMIRTEDIRGLDDIFPAQMTDLVLDETVCKMEPDSPEKAQPAPALEHRAEPAPSAPLPSEPAPRFEASLLRKVRWPVSQGPLIQLQVPTAFDEPATEETPKPDVPAEPVMEANESALVRQAAPLPLKPPGEMNAYDHLANNNRFTNHSINSLVDRYFQKCADEGESDLV